MWKKDEGKLICLPRVLCPKGKNTMETFVYPEYHVPKVRTQLKLIYLPRVLCPKGKNTRETFVYPEYCVTKVRKQCKLIVYQSIMPER